jgi:hypothetical protein
LLKGSAGAIGFLVSSRCWRVESLVFSVVWLNQSAAASGYYDGVCVVVESPLNLPVMEDRWCCYFMVTKLTAQIFPELLANISAQ